jgi:hypothetical protein
VPRRLLERAFHETYGLRLREVLGPEPSAIKSYSSSLRSLLPHVAQAEVVLHRKQFPADFPDENFHQYQARIDQAAREERWGTKREKPGFRTHLMAILIFIVPKIGPLSNLAIRGPNEPAEQDYVKSVNRCLARFEVLLKQLADHPGELALEDRDLDTGFKIKPGTYRLADKTYARLLDKIATRPDETLAEGLRENILEYFADPGAPNSVKRDEHAWKRVQEELAILQRMPHRSSSGTGN